MSDKKPKSKIDLTKDIVNDSIQCYELASKNYQRIPIENLNNAHKLIEEAKGLLIPNQVQKGYLPKSKR